jgi:ribonuclease HI
MSEKESTMLTDNTHGRIADHPKLLLQVDGGCEPKNPGGTATAGWVFYDPNKPTIILAEGCEVVQDGGPLATNNYGEYNALVLALKWLTQQNWRGELDAKADSKLLVEQVCGRWKCKAPHLGELRKKVWKLLEDLELELLSEDNLFAEEGKKPFTFIWIRRELNERPNELCHLAYKQYVAAKGTKCGATAPNTASPTSPTARSATTTPAQPAASKRTGSSPQ